MKTNLKISKFISILLSIAMLIGVFAQMPIINASAEGPPPPPFYEMLVIDDDQNGYSSSFNYEVLDLSGIYYEKVTTDEFTTKDLSKYPVIFMQGYQPVSSYEKYAEFKEILEFFASRGGVIIFGSGGIHYDRDQDKHVIVNKFGIPGGVQTEHGSDWLNAYPSYEGHPIVTGELSGKSIEAYLDLHYFGYNFIEDTLPAGSTVIFRHRTSNKPTFVEYPLGNGHVLGYTGGAMYRQLMINLFDYAIRMSNLDEEGAQILNNIYLDANAHYISAVDQDSGNLIKGAYAKLNRNTYVTNTEGNIRIDENPGEYEVIVSAEGYRISKLVYNLNLRDSRVFILEKDDGKPYASMLQSKAHTGKVYDLKTQKMFLSKGDPIDIDIDVEWNGNGTGTAELYQSDRLIGTAVNNKFTIQPGILNQNDKVYLHLTAGNGQKADTVGLGIDVGMALSEDIVEKDMDMADDKSDLTFGQKTLNNLLGKASFSIPKTPLSLKVERNKDDGTYTIRGIISTSVSLAEQILSDWAFWEKYKTEFGFMEKQIKGIKDLNNYQSLTWSNWKNNWGLEYDVTKQGLLKFHNSFSAKIDAAGYIEIKVAVKNGYETAPGLLGLLPSNDNTRYEIVGLSGGFILGAGVSKSLGHTIMLGPIPVYYELTGSLSASLLGEIACDLENDEIITTTEFTIAPEIAAGGGIGLRGVASVGVEGSAKLEMKFARVNDGFGYKNMSKGEVVLGAHLKASLNLIFWKENFKYTFAQKKIDLWDSYPKSQSSNLAAPAFYNDIYDYDAFYNDIYSYNAFYDDIDDEGFYDDIDLISMDYLQKTTPWNGTSVNYGEHKVDIMTLQQYILPSTQPQIEIFGDKYIIVFQSNIEGRDDINSLGLMYSIYENGIWSEPAVVWDTGTNDMYFNLFEKNDEVYLLWEKAKSTFEYDGDVEELMNAMSENSEMAYAKLNKNSNSFVDQCFITDNQDYDTLPTLIVSGNKITAVWERNSSNGFEISDSEIMVSDFENGNWSTPRSIATVNGFISEIAADYINGELEAAVISMDENTQQSVSIIKGSDIEVITGGELKAGIAYHGGNLYWFSDGNLYENSKIFETGDGVGINSTYKFIENDDLSAIVWMSSKTIYATIKNNNVCSNSIALLQLDEYFGEELIEGYDIEISDNGEWNVILNSYDEENEKASLSYVLIKPVQDLTLAYAQAKDSERVEGLQPIELYVANNSQKAINKFNLKVEGTNGQVYFNNNISKTINPGEIITLTQDIQIGNLVKQTDFKVTIKALNEVDLSDNSFDITLGYINLGITADRYENDENIIVSANIFNNSHTPADVTLSVIEDSPEGNVIETIPVGLLDYDKSYLYNFIKNKSEIDFDDSNVKYYYLRLDTPDNNPNEEDCIYMIIVYGDEYKNPTNDDTNNKKQKLDDCELTYRIVNSWENHNQVEIIIKNNGDKPVYGWFVDLTTSGVMDPDWNLDIANENGNNYTFKGFTHNSVIEPNSNITVGFILRGGNISDLDSMLLYQNRIYENGSIQVGVNVKDNWGSGFTGEIVIDSLVDYPLENWIMTFNCDFDISGLFAGNLITNTDGSYSIRGTDNNKILQNNSRIVLGFNGVKLSDICTITNVKFEVNRYIE